MERSSAGSKHNARCTLRKGKSSPHLTLLHRLSVGPLHSIRYQSQLQRKCARRERGGVEQRERARKQEEKEGAADEEGWS